jgi:translation initiation factor 3 subunit L
MNAAMQYLGVFASVTLSRLECLLGDHSASVAALTPLTVSSSYPLFYGWIRPPPMGVATSTPATTDEVIIPTLMVTLKPSTPEDLISSVLAARISMSYHAGVSFLMLRRYKDAIRALSSMCAFMQRGLFKSVGYTPYTAFPQQQQQQQTLVGTTATPAPTTSLPPSATVAYRKNLPTGFDQLVKMYDRMVALLAILSHICSIRPNPMDEGVQRIVLDRHGHQLAKIETGEEGYEELFLSSCPKFILAGVPHYDTAFTGGSVVHAAQDAIKLQVKHFLKEVASAASNRKLRSYMKLYTSISVEKLGRLVSEDVFLSSLLACKYNMHQLEMNDDDEGDEYEVLGAAMDTHFFINDSIIHIDEEEKQNRFESFFISQITQNQEILKDIQKLMVI